MTDEVIWKWMQASKYCAFVEVATHIFTENIGKYLLCQADMFSQM